MAVTLPYCDYCWAVQVEGWATETPLGFHFVCHACADAWAYEDAVARGHSPDTLPALEDDAPDDDPF